MTLLDLTATGGVPVDSGGAAGSLVDGPGTLQYGEMLMGAGSSARWRELVNWRSLPDSAANDTPRPQAHGSYPGDVFGESLVVTFTYLVRGTPEAKAAALATIEQYAPMDGVDRFLVVDDGDGPWYRMARVIARNVPQDKHFRHAPLECSVQFLCADPRRYSLTDRTVSVTLPVTSGGLVYPLDYPLDYGTYASGSTVATNAGSIETPFTAVFRGPLTNPELTGRGWTMGWDITLADGELLTVDTGAGTALLNGAADRLYAIATDASPLEACTIPTGTSPLTLVAEAGTGTVTVTYRDARM
jgi:hypothetical protein